MEQRVMPACHHQQSWEQLKPPTVKMPGCFFLISSWSTSTFNALNYDMQSMFFFFNTS